MFSTCSFAFNLNAAIEVLLKSGVVVDVVDDDDDVVVFDD